MGDGLIVVDQHGSLSLLNRAAERILGLNPADVASFDWVGHFSVYQADGVTRCQPDELPLARAMHGEQVDGSEFFVLAPQGTDGLWVNVTAFPLKDENGAICGGVAMFRDITQQKRAEDARAGERNLLRTVIDNLPDRKSTRLNSSH